MKINKDIIISDSNLSLEAVINKLDNLQTQINEYSYYEDIEFTISDNGVTGGNGYRGNLKVTPRDGYSVTSVQSLSISFGDVSSLWCNFYPIPNQIYWYYQARWSSSNKIGGMIRVTYQKIA